jgi:predicted dehydrogenase
VNTAPTSKVRIALIGAGTFGQRHLAYMQREPQCEIAAIADPMPAAAAFAQTNGYRYFADYRAMLDAAAPERAIIASPNALHAPMGEACAERGVHILVEKPIAETLAAANGLAAAVERAGVALLVGHHRRYNPVIEKAREIVRGGGVGRLTTVVAMWLIRKPDDYFDVAWRRGPGGGPVLINLIHDIDDLRFICGEIASVQALTAAQARGFSVEDTAVIALRFADGALGSVTASDAVPAPWSWEMTSGEAAQYPQRPENCYLFSGSEGSLTVPRLELWRYDGPKSWTQPLGKQTLEVANEDPLVRQLRHFCAVIRGTEQARITGADATRTLAATLAVHASARDAKVIDLDDSTSLQ